MRRWFLCSGYTRIPSPLHLSRNIISVFPRDRTPRPPHENPHRLPLLLRSPREPVRRKPRLALSNAGVHDAFGVLEDAAPGTEAGGGEEGRLDVFFVRVVLKGELAGVEVADHADLESAGSCGGVIMGVMGGWRTGRESGERRMGGLNIPTVFEVGNFQLEDSWPGAGAKPLDVV